MTPGSTASRGAKGRDIALTYPSPRWGINSCSHELWWSWRRCRHLVSVVRENGVGTTGEWYRLKKICNVVSDKKRAYLRGQFADVFSDASLAFLFEEGAPA
jgi:hypothetical protein